MNQTQFDRILQELTHRRREVLRQVLAGNSDGSIAQSLHITESTVRKHVENICKHFGIRHDFSDDRRSKRPELVALFRQHPPKSHSFVTATLQQCIDTWMERGKPQNRGAFLISTSEQWVMGNRNGMRMKILPEIPK